MSEKTSENRPENPEWLPVVIRKVDSLRFGSVQIIVHDGRVTQVESLEKVRMPCSAEPVRHPS